MSEMTHEDQLALAQGVTPEAQKQIRASNLINYFNQSFPDESTKSKRAYWQRRRELRRHMLRLRKKLHQQQQGYKVSLSEEELIVKTIIDDKLKPNLGLTWDTFTFQWDVNPNPTKPLTIIQPNEWFKEGGGIDDDIGVYHPTAFTKQEM